jgi:hypothetical protein
MRDVRWLWTGNRDEDEQGHQLALAADDQPIAVMLDLVHPFGPGRRLVGKRRDAGGDKSITPDARSNQHLS